MLFTFGVLDLWNMMHHTTNATNLVKDCFFTYPKKKKKKKTNKQTNKFGDCVVGYSFIGYFLIPILASFG